MQGSTAQTYLWSQARRLAQTFCTDFVDVAMAVLYHCPPGWPVYCRLNYVDPVDGLVDASYPWCLLCHKVVNEAHLDAKDHKRRVTNNFWGIDMQGPEAAQLMEERVYDHCHMATQPLLRVKNAAGARTTMNRGLQAASYSNQLIPPPGLPLGPPAGPPPGILHPQVPPAAVINAHVTRFQDQRFVNASMKCLNPNCSRCETLIPVVCEEGEGTDVVITLDAEY